MVSMFEQDESNRAVHNIIAAIVESNIKESAGYVIPKKRGNIFNLIQGHFHPAKNQMYQVILKERVVSIILSISAIDYKGIVDKIEDLQSRIQEEVYLLTGYKVSYIHVKLS
ncbi:hypothetical protein [Robertmurraya korlensis]|uniref:hypothetical protein n=1 Tax=Robertmurraya korlensis TaxID=519977 RepID=UPI0008252196|nr:hypothetical protein [Robertmurraya korlensis]